MVLFIPVILKQLFYLGRLYPWPKPECCPRCGGHRLWGHGFVEAFFDEFAQTWPAAKALCGQRPGVQVALRAYCLKRHGRCAFSLACALLLNLI